MAYTPLLGLSLPVTGTLSGTWGDEINNSITSLVDSAVAGTTTLSTDADVTLTTTGGVSNTAREAVLLCTGARTAVRYITAPAQSKTYTVINATTGGYNVYIRGAGPTAGIAVPMGYAVQVAWNSTDFVQTSVPVTRISGLGTGVATALGISVGTAGSPVVNGGALGTPSSGTLTSATGLPISTGVSGLGTGVATALAVNVGTAGSVVVNGGVLGTPSSGTLTNATGLPISTGVSGLGTGVATALAVNVGTAGSPVVNGGALGTPSSGTVTNLTGTANITATGGASGAIAATTLSASSTVSGTGFSTYLASPPAIGGTAPAAVSATSLTDSGNLTFTGTGNRITGDFSNATLASRVMFQTSTANGRTVISAIPNGTGTGGTFAAYGSSDLANSATLTTYVDTSANTTHIASGITGTGTYLPMTFYTGGSERVRVDTSGNVGIGKTPVAGRGVLQVNGDVEMTSQNTGQLAGLRNRIINGAMTIDQRNAGASVANPAAAQIYTLDRWNIYGILASKFTCQQASATPPSGFANYMAFTSSAATTPAATDIYVFGTKPEGFNIADFAWGTANAKSVTLSFRVYSSLTGTFGGSVGNSAANRNYVFSYSIPVASTWTTISVTIPGDTSGTWLVNNAVGAQMYFDLGSGTSQKTTAGTWGSTFYYGVTGGVNVVATNAATFYITGVQLELGSVATPFEQRPYGMELALCQRYYYKFANTTADRYYSGSVSAVSSTRIIASAFTVPCPLRVFPTVTYSGIDIYNSSYSSIGSITYAAVYAIGTVLNPSLDLQLASGLTTGSQYIVTLAPTTGYIGFSAEL